MISLYYFQEKKLNLILGVAHYWPCSCLSRVLKEQFLKVLGLFFSELQRYNISYRY